MVYLSPTSKFTLDDIWHRRFLMPRSCPVLGQGAFVHSRDLETHLEGSYDAVHAVHIVLTS